MTGVFEACGLASAEGLAEAGADVAIVAVIPLVEAFFTTENRVKWNIKHFK